MEQNKMENEEKENMLSIYLEIQRKQRILLQKENLAEF